MQSESIHEVKVRPKVSFAFAQPVALAFQLCSCHWKRFWESIIQQLQLALMV